MPKTGRPKKPVEEKFIPRSLRFHPRLWQEFTELVPAGERSAVIQTLLEREVRRLRRQAAKTAAEIRENATTAAAPTQDRPIWEIIDELVQQVPEEDLATLPTDLAEQHDHYLYGTPKR